GQPDHGERGQPGGDVGLDLHEAAVEAGEPDREGACVAHQHTASRCSGAKVPPRWAWTATASICTQRCGAERYTGYPRARRRRRRSLSGVTAACGTPVTKERRVLTSTKTRVVWASATMSSSPCFRRRLRSTICQPQALRWAAARSSPARPRAAVLISRTRRGGGEAIGPAGGGSAAGPGTMPAAGPGTGRPVDPVLFARLFMRPA